MCDHRVLLHDKAEKLIEPGRFVVLFEPQLSTLGVSIPETCINPASYSLFRRPTPPTGGVKV